jgi:hypothetical protein
VAAVIEVAREGSMKAAGMVQFSVTFYCNLPVSSRKEKGLAEGCYILVTRI